MSTTIPAWSPYKGTIKVDNMLRLALLGEGWEEISGEQCWECRLVYPDGRIRHSATYWHKHHDNTYYGKQMGICADCTQKHRDKVRKTILLGRKLKEPTDG